ncbi:leucine-rich repeat-containing protein 19 [Rhinophrynus dorsalis]
MGENQLNWTILQNYPNLTELHITNNKITTLEDNLFSGLSELELLDLRNNSIMTVQPLSFGSLVNLKKLDLSYNQISQFPSNISLPSGLKALNLQNNSLTNLEIRHALNISDHIIHVTLSGNPWNCNCSLAPLSHWLNGLTVLLENFEMTFCATPKNMSKKLITEIVHRTKGSLNCDDNRNTATSSAPVLTSSTPVGINKSASTFLPTSFNGTTSTPKKGNSWTFLVGVVVVGIITSLLILFAIKFPRWYDYLLSYNHHRLKEEEPDMFEAEFSVDLNMSATRNNMEEEETVVVFEQMHSFVPEEDGFIEDKYIDDRDMRAES